MVHLHNTIAFSLFWTIGKCSETPYRAKGLRPGRAPLIIGAAQLWRRPQHSSRLPARWRVVVAPPAEQLGTFAGQSHTLLLSE